MNTAVQSAGVLSFEDAYEVVREYCEQLLKAEDRPSEEVLLMQAVGRVLAEPVKADRDFPPFPRATRDGFALRADDLASGKMLLRVVGQVRAGDSYDLPLASGEAVEIMTGAAVPAGADAVVMVEYTERRSEEINHKGHKETQREESENRQDIAGDDQILNIAGDAKPSPQEKWTEDLVEIQRTVTTGKTLCRQALKPRQGKSYYRAECAWDRRRLPWLPQQAKPV